MSAISSASGLRVAAKEIWASATQTDLRKAVLVSVGAHVTVVAAVLVSSLNLSLPEPEKLEDRPLMTFDISGAETDSEEKYEIPEILPPMAAENATGDVVVEETSEIPAPVGGSGDVKRLWTPPPPDRQIATGLTSGSERSKALIIDTIENPGEGTDPQLIEFDAGRFTQSAALNEASRLQGEGRLKMTLTIDEQGIPIGCTTSETSGSNLLDQLGCELVMDYRYEPGRGPDQRPRGAVVYEYLEWSSTGSAASNEEGAKPKGFRRSDREEIDALEKSINETHLE